MPGDALVSGLGFGPDTGRALSGAAGATAVAPMWSDTGAALRFGPAAVPRGQVPLLVVDGAAAEKVLRLSGSGLRLPSALTAAVPGGDPVPALVSPAVAAQVGGAGSVDVQGTTYRFRVAAVAAEAPGLGAGPAVRGAAGPGVAGGGGSAAAVQPVRRGRCGCGSGCVAPGR